MPYVAPPLRAHRPPPGVDPRRLADHSLETLAAWLAGETGVASTRARRAAGKALRVAFAADDATRAPYDDAALIAGGIGAWARPALLTLDAGLSLTVAHRAPSADGTVKLLLRTADDHLIESVLIPAARGRRRARVTLCISSQVGCARACTFCETGAHGLNRHLHAHEIVDQYRIARAICASASTDRPRDRREPPSAGKPRSGRTRLPAAQRPVSNIVFMGMGEPMDNLRRVQRAIDLLTTPQAFDFAPSRVTVSTVGRADKLADFFASTRAELAISINAPDDQRRARIMPINERHDLATLKKKLLDVMPRGRRVLFQYALFGGFNDSLDDADLLAAYVRDVPCRVNVIPANPGPDPALFAPTPTRVDAFVARLASHGVTTLVRRPRGRDVGGACGQLAGRRRGLAVLDEATPPEPGASPR